MVKQAFMNNVKPPLVLIQNTLRENVNFITICCTCHNKTQRRLLSRNNNLLPKFLGTNDVEGPVHQDWTSGDYTGSCLLP